MCVCGRVGGGCGWGWGLSFMVLNQRTLHCELQATDIGRMTYRDWQRALGAVACMAWCMALLLLVVVHTALKST